MTTSSEATRTGDRQRALTYLSDVVADTAILVVWVMKMLGWFVLTGVTASGWAAIGVPESGPWLPTPRLAVWHLTHRRLLREIDAALSLLPDRRTP